MESRKKSSKKIFLFVPFALILVVILGIGVYHLSVLAADSAKLREQMDLGNHYLEELDYEQAVLAFTAAIEINPKNVEAYIGVADAYIGLGDFESAKAILEQGLENNIASAELQGKLNEVQMEMERIEREAEEKRIAEEKAKQEAEEKAKQEAEKNSKLDVSLKPLYDKLKAGENDMAIMEYVQQEGILDIQEGYTVSSGEVEKSYSEIGDTENGIVLDIYSTYMFYGEKTNDSYETTGSWYYLKPDFDEVGGVFFDKYEGEWRNGAPNGYGTWYRILSTHYSNDKEQEGMGIERDEIVSTYKDGCLDGDVVITEYEDIFDWLDWWNGCKNETRYRAKDGKMIEDGITVFYNEDGTITNESRRTKGNGIMCVAGPWVSWLQE